MAFDLMISTDRLVITEFTEGMAESVHLNSLDEDNRNFVPDEVFETVQEAEETIRFLMDCYQGTEGPFVYPVLLKSGENIGHVQAVPYGDGWEVGYHIAAKYTGNGYATEAVRAFLPIIMKLLDLKQIWGVCRRDNVASCRVLEKCAFKLVSCEVANYHGREHEVCKYIYSVEVEK